MHEGHHGILENVDDLDAQFGKDKKVEDKKAEDKKDEKHDHDHGHAHPHTHDKA